MKYQGADACLAAVSLDSGSAPKRGSSNHLQSQQHLLGATTVAAIWTPASCQALSFQ